MAPNLMKTIRQFLSIETVDDFDEIKNFSPDMPDTETAEFKNYLEKDYSLQSTIKQTKNQL